MATLNPNTLIGIIQGRLGDLVFVRRKDGKIFVRRRPAREAPTTPAEKLVHNRLVESNSYVQRSKQQADQYAAYQAAARASGKRACDLAKADFGHRPAIHDVDVSEYTGKPGERFWIRAVDDFGVISVTVTLTQLDGVLLEHGAAVMQVDTSKWLYTTQAAVPAGQTVVVHISASDRPGNAATKTVQHALV